MILGKLKTDAEAFLGDKVTQAVITVPAYFDDSQRQATKDAGQIAGLEVLRIINEPTAAALAYGLDKKKDELSPSTTWAAAPSTSRSCELGEGVFEVKATNGDTHLGGDDFDERIIDWLIEEFKKDQGIDLTERPDGPSASEGSRGEGEDRALQHAADRDQPAVHHRGPAGPKHLAITLTRRKLEQLVGDLVEKTTQARARQALADAGVEPQARSTRSSSSAA